jgi:hypothetical protein
MATDKPRIAVRASRAITIGLRKPTLGARVLHISINNRAWLKAAMSKRIAFGGKKNG